MDKFKDLKETAARLGACDPDWLRKGIEPKIDVVEPGGNGPVMLLLHGLFGALSNWDSVISLMQGYSHPIALQFPLLSGTVHEVKVKALAIYTEHFIRSRGYDKVILCGNSLGGHVALRLYLARPELVDCMILAGSSGLYEHNPDTVPVRPDHHFIRDHMGRVFSNKKFVTDEAVDEILQIVKDRKNVLNIIHSARSAKKDNLEKVLPNVKCPTLLLWGEEDQVTTMDVAETFKRLIPNSILATIKGCGHAPMIENPQWFSAQVQDFIKKYSKLNGTP